MAHYRTIVDLGSAPTILTGVRERRAGLRSAMGELEATLSHAAAGQSEYWAAQVRTAVERTAGIWSRHVADTESPGAFLDEVAVGEPRVVPLITNLRREHSDIQAEISRIQRVLLSMPSEQDCDEWVEGIRNRLTTLLWSFAKHRQHSADLIYEAYNVDIGGG